MTRPRFHLLLMFGAAIFLSAFLLFLIQPILAKLILPWFGGSAAVWTTCLVFYQTALVAGYYYANLIVTRLPGRPQSVIHTALLAAALAFLPAIPGDRWKLAVDHPAARILLLLVAVVGLPYFLLSSTGPLLQAWYAQRWPGSQPYRMFALSNAGALIALLAYPSLIEPRIATHTQDLLWSGGFGVFAVLCGAVSLSGSWKTTGRDVSSANSAAATPVPARDRWTWIILAAAGSMLLLSTTNQLTENVAAVPLLWIVPLALYLVTFILCFESSRWYPRPLFQRLLAIALGAVGYASYDIRVGETLPVSIPLFAGALFIGCMFCHGELAARKPSGEHLTSFYLMIALGGALGGIFVGLVAPVIFSGVYELSVTLLLIAILASVLNWDQGWSQRLLWGVASVAMALVLVAQIGAYHRNTIVLERDFYGSLRVVETGGTRTLYHGTVMHGSQFLSPTLRDWPTTYYGPPSGIGLALRNCCAGSKRVGVVGLGTGTLAIYGTPGDEIRFYEINPEVTAIAESRFTFLRDSRAKISIAPGDARLSLEREAPQRFDVLAIDAFSGDAIPVHLLTREAVELYQRHLAPGGVIAFHVSNRFLDLAPAVSRVAQACGLRAVQVESPRDDDLGLSSATWVLVTRNVDFLSRPAIAKAAEAIPPRNIRLWTDDYNNLLQLLRR